MLESETSNTTATTLEVVYEVDLAGKLSGRKIFIEELEKAVPHCYQEAGQWLKAWSPAPPKISRESAIKETEQLEAADQLAASS